MRRFPIILIINSNENLAAIPSELIIIVTRLGFTWIAYAFSIWIMYGRHDITPQNWVKNSSVNIKTNGLKIRRRESCFNLSSKDSVWLQFHGCFTHWLHAFDAIQYFWRCWYSSRTASGDTHPRNHCNDLSAFSWRRLDNKKIGVSGTYSKQISSHHLIIKEIQNRINFLTKNIAIHIQTGMMVQSMATCRHDKNAPSTNSEK